ncbi:Putative alcohol dehydrogenase, zinc-type, GroES-like superfamily, NAD(P)-binding domain superfamily [Septoria linicola]|uniref:Alcohol dehydrogenase, zinc-type, GroES-like superfamily, NAD(P)-binding domain superfamily n=1 Tax=Septoria linicola TaxID=215465 RepID=A0A9Q9AUB9_9PEZI|nr:Putative alcohol dehydrogenase, zinc-type, GroES-like superfamily, NAD(P)-binding domain superfamily [Septoria linicola]
MSSLPGNIWAWRCSQGAPQPLHKERRPLPELHPNGLLVKIKAMGVCHSDCLILSVPTAQPGKEEFTLGHEGAGEIVQIGPEVNPATFQLGDTVAIHPVPGCGSCPSCKAGYQRICQTSNNGGYGLGYDGFMQEYVSVRADACVKVPEGVTVEHACIAADALLTAFHAVKYTADVRPEQTVAILGLGGLGLNAVQTAKHLGVKRIVVVDKRQEAVDIAVRLGVEREDAYSTGSADTRPVQDVLAERGVVVDTVIDFVGHEQTITLAQRIVRPIGLIVMVGLLSMQVPVFPGRVAQNCLTIKGSFCGTMEGLGEVLQLVKDGVITPEVSTASIEDLPQVLKDLDDGKINGRKVLLPEWSA